MAEQREILHAHFFCGLGGGARGFNRGRARVGNLEAKFRCIGGIDVDRASIRDFDRLAGVRGTVLDLFSLDQYLAFHGKAPPEGWREATTSDVHAAFGHERPNIVFLSAPCKGFSGLLAERTSQTDKYQALNALTLRGMFLMLEAYKDDPPELIIFENVPRIATRGRALLDRIVALLQHYGYATAETTHDCGVIGGLAQSRKRFLLVARHAAKVPPFLYEPEQKRLRGVGEVLDKLPLPGAGVGGPMHRMPALQWKTWVRLAFVEAGSDWRSLNKLAIEDGHLRDFGILPDQMMRDGSLGVRAWDQHAHTVTSRTGPTNNAAANVADPRAEHWGAGQLGVTQWDESAPCLTAARSPMQGRFSVADPRATWGADSHRNKLRVVDYDDPASCVTGADRVGSGALSVADPRIDGHHKSVQMGVRSWESPAAVVKGDVSVGTGPYAVADPRVGELGPRFNNVYRIVPWAGHAQAVTGQGGNSAAAVADPRPSQREDYKQTKYRVTALDEAAGTVIAASTTGNGAFAVADPRMDLASDEHRYRDTSRHYGVVGWEHTSRAVPGFAKHDNGPWSVADPRPADGGPGFALPEARDRLVAVIRALDGTWHRPFTTLELAALQSLFDPDDLLELDGQSDSAWRERIGNAVPSDAAEAIAGVMGTTLLMAWTGETFMLSAQPIWVRPLAVALAVDTPVIAA